MRESFGRCTLFIGSLITLLVALALSVVAELLLRHRHHADELEALSYGPLLAYGPIKSAD